MSSAQPAQCLICSKTKAIMMPLTDIVDDCDGLSVAQVLENLQFLTIPNVANLNRTLCCVCVTRIQSSFELKHLCSQVDRQLKSLTAECWAVEKQPDEIKLEDEDFNAIFKNDESSNDDNWGINNDSNLSDGIFKIEIEEFGDQPQFNIDAQPSSSTNEKNLHGKELSLDDLNLTCCYCPKVFESKKKLVVHLTCHDNKKRNYNILNAPLEAIRKYTPKPVKKMFSCSVCFQTFQIEEFFKKHMQNHSDENERPFVCDVCNLSFRSIVTLRRHQKRHVADNTDKKYSCTICKTSFNDKKPLMAHMTRHNTSRFICEICGKTLMRKGNLIKHLETHSGKKLFKCNVCNKSFTRYRTLIGHGIIHTGKKPYKCDTCDESFTWQRSLELHRLNHTGERPYKCEVCDKAYKTLNHLKAHQKTHLQYRMMRFGVCKD